MKNKSQSRLTLALAIVYGLLVVWIILFKMSPIPEIPYLDHIRHINLIPFHYDTEVDSHAQEVIENLLIFIPLGLYLKMEKKDLLTTMIKNHLLKGIFLI